MYVIHEPKEISFKKVGIVGKIFPIEKLTNKTEYFLVTTEHGHQTAIIEHGCDFIYYVLQGKGYFVVDGHKETCRAGDLVVIPAGRTFTYKGRLKMIATSTPPWWEGQDETLH